MANTPNFCTQCGASLEEGQNFCTQCGEPVAATIIPAAFQQAATNDLDIDATTVMPAAESTTTISEQRTYSQPDPHVAKTSEHSPDQANEAAATANQKQPTDAKTKRNIMIGIIIALGVIVLALVGFLIFSSITNNKTDSESNQQTTVQEAQKQASSNSSSEETSTSTSATSARDKAIYNDLLTYYNNLETYDSKISTAASNFNNNYLKKDSSLRSRYKSDATSLLNTISADYNALFDLNISASSEYYDCYDKLLTCYYDCKMRISVICDSWSNSLRYSDPTGHEAEICEPLERDRVDGNNKYYTEFNQIYPNARPAEPRS